MKDERGLYYYPFPSNKKVRMYVRESEGAICFRLWNSEDQELWVAHGWTPYEAIEQAAAMYKRRGDFDPESAYNVDIAKALLKEDEGRGIA